MCLVPNIISVFLLTVLVSQMLPLLPTMILPVIALSLHLGTPCHLKVSSTSGPRAHSIFHCIRPASIHPTPHSLMALALRVSCGRKVILASPANHTSGSSPPRPRTWRRTRLPASATLTRNVPHECEECPGMYASLVTQCQHRKSCQ